MDPSTLLLEQRTAASEAVATLGEGAVHGETLAWLERQLHSIVRQLDGLLADLDSGLSLADVGFSNEDFEDMIEDLGNQIANLVAMIRRAREQGR